MLHWHMMLIRFLIANENRAIQKSLKRLRQSDTTDRATAQGKL